MLGNANSRARLVLLLLTGPGAFRVQRHYKTNLIVIVFAMSYGFFILELAGDVFFLEIWI